jgi:hypothetical protein
VVCAADVFHFDCPACGTRQVMTIAERGRLRTCGKCGIAFPAPEFHAAGRLPGPACRDQEYAVHCTHCGVRQTVRETTAGQLHVCDRCAATFRQPLPDWERWRRPVARVLPNDDFRASPQVSRQAGQMAGRRAVRTRATDVPTLTALQPLQTGAALGPAAAAWFEFYCGACGVVQRAGVWQIALPGRCTVCGLRLVVPAPRARAPVSAAAWRLVRAAPLPGARGLYCPKCGAYLAHADRTRNAAANCVRCAVWF